MADVWFTADEKMRVILLSVGRSSVTVPSRLISVVPTKACVSPKVPCSSSQPHAKTSAKNNTIFLMHITG